MPVWTFLSVCQRPGRTSGRRTGSQCGIGKRSDDSNHLRCSQPSPDSGSSLPRGHWAKDFGCAACGILRRDPSTTWGGHDRIHHLQTNGNTMRLPQKGSSGPCCVTAILKLNKSDQLLIFTATFDLSPASAANMAAAEKPINPASKLRGNVATAVLYCITDSL